jgi:hypothetical protein
MEDTADRIHAHVAQLAATGATAAELAAAAGEDWRAIEAVLSPIVGGRGFVAIVQRSLHLLDQSQQVLIDVESIVAGSDPIDAWQQALSAHSPADACEASARLLHVFCHLLAALIGGSLSERLLRPVWDRPARGAEGQDSTP